MADSVIGDRDVHTLHVLIHPCLAFSRHASKPV